MTEERRIQLAAEVDTTRTRAGFNEIGQQAAGMATNVARSGEQAQRVISSIGDGADTAAQKVSNAQRNLLASLQRTIAGAQAEVQGIARGSAEFFEMRAASLGIDPSKIAPLVEQLRAINGQQAELARSADEARASQERAAEAARAEAAAQLEVVAAMARRDQFLNGLREQVALYSLSSEEVLRFRAAQLGAADAAEPLIRNLREQRDAQEQVTTAARAAAQAEREAVQAQNTRDSFIASLRDQAEAIGRTRAELLELRAAQLGVSDQAGPFIARLREAEAGLGRTGISAAQTAAALRGVPAQFTDIVTSLQGGQAPLTVFLQQGGQLRDMFGSAGGAARALGGYIVGLINPLTLAAVAVGALAVAYNQGSKEGDAYARALILTGNAAGTTTGQLTEMARAISKTAGTQGDAAGALAALAGSGKVGVENLQRFATVAVKAQRDIGTATSETARDFAELAKAPLATSEKLNEQYHYLTGSIYAQIKALQDQGRADDAAEVAQKAYATALDDRSSKLEAHLGSIQRGWRGVMDFAKGAWDAMLGVGREDTLEQQLERVQARLASLQKGKGNQKSMLGGPVGFDTSTARSEEERQLLAQEKVLKGKKEERDWNAKVAADTAKLNESDIEWQKLTAQFLPRQVQLENELQAVRNKGLAAGRSDSEIATAQLEVRKKYADIYNDQIDAQIEKSKRLAAVQDEVAKRTAAALASLRTRGNISEDDFIQQSAAQDRAGIQRRIDELQKELDLTKQKQNSQKAQAELQGQIEQLGAQAVTRQKQAENELAELEVRRFRAAANNTADLFDKRSADLQAIKGQVQAQRDANAVIGQSQTEQAAYTAALREEVAARLEGNAAILDTILGKEKEAEALRESAAQLRQLSQEQAAGAAKALDFDKQKQLWQEIDRTAHDTFVNIFNGGKSAFDRLRDTLKSGLLDLLYQMTIKQWVFNIGAQVSGYSAIGSLAGATLGGQAGGVLGGVSTVVGGAGAIKSGLGIVNGGLIGAGNSISGLGTALGSTTIADFGAGLSGLAPAAAQAYGGTMTAAAGFGASVNAAIAAIPGWGWAALGAAAVASYLGVFSGDGPEQNTHLTFGSNNAAGNISINERGNEGKNSSYIDNYGTSALGTFGVTNSFWMSSNSDAVQSFIQTVSQTDDALAAFMTTAEKASVSSYLTGKNDTAQTGPEGSNPNASGALDKVFADRINNILEGVQPGLSALESGFTGTSQQLASEAAALLQYRAALKDSGEAVFGAKVTLQDIAALKAPTEATSVALTRVANEFQATNQVASMFGVDSAKAFGAAGLASEAARAQVIMLSGGLSTFTSQASDYAQNFLTDAQRLAPVAKQLDASLASLGLSTIPTTKAQFASLIDQIVSSGALATEQGAKQYAGLMALESAFAQVHAEEAATSKSMGDIASERADLLKQLDEATMTQAQLADKARAAIDGHNLALYDQVKTAQAAKAAADALASTNADFQKQIDDLLKANMSAAEVRAMETKGMDASTVALYDRLAALHASVDAEKAAADAIAKAQASAAAATQSFGNALASSMDAATNAAKAFRALNDALLISDSSTLSPEQKYTEAKRQFDTADSAHLKDAEKAFLDASKAWFGGSAGYAADFAAVLARNSSEAASQDAAAAAMPGIWKAFMAQMAGSGAAHADGGFASGWSLVGEKGPEIVNFTQPGRVYTAAQSREMMSGSSSSASMERTNVLLEQVLTELRAGTTQRGAVAEATLMRLETVATKLDDTKRVIAKATA